MTLASALAKIFKANNEEEIEQASREFSEGMEEFKQQIVNHGSSPVDEQAENGVSHESGETQPGQSE